MSAAVQTPDDADWIWTRFWQFDRVASCLDGPNHAGYVAEVAQGWQRFFGRLPETARVLDLCTGNGAIALIAAEALPAGRIAAIDRAAIDPARHVAKFGDLIARIDFRGGVAAEALPFADAGFDAVVSQYGFEYAERAPALAEILRVLAPGGQVRLVVHAAEGAPRAGAAQVIADCDLLLETLDLPGKTLAAIEAVGAHERGTGSIEEARAAFTAFTTALDAARAHAPQARDVEMLDNSLFVLSDAYHRRREFPLAALRAKIDEVQTEIAAQRGRSTALSRVAMTADAANALAGALSGYGIAAEASRLIVAGDLVGHVIEGRSAG